MIKKRFYSMLAKLAVVFIVLSSIPVYAVEEKVSGNEIISGNMPAEDPLPENDDPAEEEDPLISGTEPAAGDGTSDMPRITKLDIFVYDDPDDPDRATNVYSNGNADFYGYSHDQDAGTPYYDKRYIYYSGASESAPKIRFVATSDRSDVEFEFERLHRDSGKVEFTTGRIPENYYVCEDVGNYRIHVYATDGSGGERIYYTHCIGMDSEQPVVSSVRFSYVGESKPDKTGRVRYGAGKVTVIGAYDRETRLHEKPYMFDYPNGEWVASNELPARTGNFSVGTRDAVGNVRTDFIQVYYIDMDPPVTTLTEYDTPSVNGFKKLVSMKVEAEDETNIPEDFLSVDGENWLTGDTVDISENGAYDVYTRDVFGHVSKNTIEVSNIDKEAPRYSYNIEHISRGGGYSKEEILHVIAVDSKSGLDAAAYSYDEGRTWVTKTSLAISENGTYCVRVRDALGNESTDTHIEVRDIDNKKPRINEISENRTKTSGIYAASSRVTVSAEDEDSGIAEKGIFFEEKGSWGSDKSITVSKNGIINVRVKDRVGNTESSSIKVENIDAAAPECVIRGNPETLTMSKITLTLELKDPLSGIKSVYMSDSRVGMKKLIKEYPCNEDGAGEHNDTLDVEITSNGEYLFFVTDMCGNEKRESVTVTKIIIPKTPSKPEDPSDPDDGKEGGGGGGSGTKPGDGDVGSGKGGETVIIGNGDSGKTGKDTKTGTGITVRNKTVSEDKTSDSSKQGISENRYSRYDDPDAEAFEEKEKSSGNELTDAYAGDDYSTDIFESGEEEYFAENSPKELEMIPNPDEIETTEAKPSKAGTIAATAVLIVVGLSALTVFLLVKKGLITLPDLFGKNAKE